MIREGSSSGLLLGQQSTKRSKVTDSTVTILGPENMKTTRTKKSTNPIEDSIPLSDRLEPVSKQVRRNFMHFIEMQAGFSGFSPTFNSLQKSSSLPTSESLTQLLTQAVASGDGKLLEEVLRVHKEKIIRATIQRLPVTVVLPFLRKVVQNTVASLLF